MSPLNAVAGFSDNRTLFACSQGGRFSSISLSLNLLVEALSLQRPPGHFTPQVLP